MRCVINLNEFTFKDLKAAANSRVNAKFLLAKVKKTAQADFAKHVRETFRGVVYLDKKKIADAVYAGKIFAVPVTNFRRIETPLTLDEFAAKYGVAKRLRMPWNPAELIEGNFGG